MFKKIAAVITSLTLIFAIGGVTIFQHHCTCEENTSLSVFIDEDCCSHESYQTASCCKEESPVSCCSSDTERDHNCDSDNKDCCSTETKFLKLSNPFNIPVKSSVVKAFTQLFIGLVFSQNLDNVTISSSPLLSFTDNSPPPLDARFILISHHQLKLSPDHIS